MESFIILSTIWYKMLTRCYLLHTYSSRFRELEKSCQITYFFYQHILLGPLNYDSQGFSSETHVLGSWVENKITHHWLWWDNLPWVVMMSWDMSPIDEVEDLGLKPIMWCRENVDQKFASRNWATGLIHLVE